MEIKNISEVEEHKAYIAYPPVIHNTVVGIMNGTISKKQYNDIIDNLVESVKDT